MTKVPSGLSSTRYRGSFWADWMNTEQAGGVTTLDFSAGWRLGDFASWFTKAELKVNWFNLTDKHALTFDSSTTLLATKGALDPTTGKARMRVARTTTCWNREPSWCPSRRRCSDYPAKYAG